MSQGIISNHIEQRDLLIGMVGSGAGTDEAINTVDAFQGSERDVIIISPMLTVRASNKRLLNVALSRAKQLVVVVADLDQLGTLHPELWGKVVS